jgi:alkylation response protein AidB-like acyl-CoA dehydrogenase
VAQGIWRRGYSRENAGVLKEEMQRIRARPPLVSFGSGCCGGGSAKGGKLADPIVRAEIAHAAIDTYASEATRRQYLTEAANGGEICARSALLICERTELNKRRHQLLMSLAGAVGLYFDGNLGPAQDAPRGWLALHGNSIEGGTSEIMLDIVAKRLLEPLVS